MIKKMQDDGDASYSDFVITQGVHKWTHYIAAQKHAQMLHINLKRTLTRLLK